MKIDNRDDLNMLLSLCDLGVKYHGLNVNPRVYKLAEDFRAALAKLPDVPTPLTNLGKPPGVEELEHADERAKGIKGAKQTLDDLNEKRS